MTMTDEPRGRAIQDEPTRGVRCPTPGCGKLLIEALAGKAVIRCRHCEQTHGVERDDVIGRKPDGTPVSISR